MNFLHKNKNLTDNTKYIKEHAHEWAYKKLDTVKLSADDYSNLQDRLYKMIQYSVARFDWFEEQRYKLLQIGLSLIALSAALSVIFANKYADIGCFSKLSSVASLITLAITGCLLIFNYRELISPKYPHRKLADIRSWFFLYNIDENLPAFLSKNKAKAEKQVRAVEDNYKRYIDNWIDFAQDKKKLLIEDIEQVFILQVLQSYRMKSLIYMRRRLTLGLALFLFFFFLTIILIINKA